MFDLKNETSVADIDESVDALAPLTPAELEMVGGGHATVNNV